MFTIHTLKNISARFAITFAVLVAMLVPALAFANVSVTTATGGSAISADTTSGSYTTLTGPTVTEASNQDFTSSSGTFILKAPTGFVFNTSSSVTATITTTSGSASSNCFKFSSSTATPASGTITFTMSSRDSSSVVCKVVFSGIQVRPSAGTPLASGNLTNSGSTSINGMTSSTNLGTLTEVAGAKNKLGMKTQPSASASLGLDFPTKPAVYVQDQFGNTVTSDNSSGIAVDPVLSSQSCGGTAGSGALITTPVSGASDTNGVMTYTAMQYSAAESIKLCFSSAGLTSILSNAISVTTVDLTADVVSPTAATAGTPVTLTTTLTNLGGTSSGVAFTTLFQKATDSSGTGATDIGTTASPVLDANLIEPATLSYTFTGAGTTYVRACADKSSGANAGIIAESNENNNCGAWTAVSVSAGAFSKLQVLLPGETAAPGTASGKSGTPTAQTAGSVFNVTVNAVDANWNPVSASDTVTLSSSDASALLPAGAALSGGTQTFAMIFKTAGSATVTASDTSDSSKTANTSSSATVNGGSFVQLQVLAPGETAAPGTPSGKSGSPNAQLMGGSFSVTVNAVDSSWNKVSSSDRIAITSSDSSATLPSSNTLSSGSRSFAVTLATQGAATVTASDTTNAAMTAYTSPAITVNYVDLTADITGPPSATVGTAVTLSATVSNNGNASSGTSFTTLFQKATDSLGTGATDIGTASIATLGSGLTAPATRSYTFTTAGTSYIRACADKSSSANSGVIPESNENNNCGAWTAVSVAAGAFDHFGFSTVSSQTAGTAFNVIITALDVGGNTVTSYVGTVDLSTTAGTITPSQSDTFVGGMLTQTVTVTKTGSTRTITATDHGGTQTGTSNTFTVNAGSFVKLQLLVPGETAAPGTATGKTGTPSAQTAGASFSVTVNAVDANWNVVNASDRINITSSDSAATLPSSNTLSSGSRTFTVTLGSPGTNTVTATDSASGSKTANTSPSITVNYVDLIIGNTTLTSATAGTAVNLTATITNQGNASTGASFTTLFQKATDASGTGATDIGTDTDSTLAGLSATESTTLSYTFTTAGTSYIRACADKSSSSNSGVIPESNENNNCGNWVAVTVVPGALDHFAFATIADQAPSVAFGVTMTAQDKNNNTVTSYIGTVDLSTTAGTITPSQSAAFVAGVRTEGSVKLTGSGSAATITAKDHGGTKTGTSNAFAVTITSVPLYPVSEGNFNQWVPNTGTAIAAEADSDTATYIDSTNAMLMHTFSVANATAVPTGAAINSVTMYVVARGVTAGASMQFVVEKDSTHVVTSTTTPSLSTSYATYAYTFSTTGDSKAWTQSEVASWTNSFGIKAAAGGLGVRVTQMYVVVNYSQSGACQLGVELSWDGGTSWTTQKKSSNLSSAPATYIFGKSSDTWTSSPSHTWAISDFSLANFRARVQAVNPGSACASSDTDHLDWLRMNVFYNRSAPRGAALNAADAAKESGVNLFTIYYNSSPNDTDKAFMAELANGIQPYPPYQNGSYYNATTSSSGTPERYAALAASPAVWTNSKYGFTTGSSNYATSKSASSYQGYTNFDFTGSYLVAPTATINYVRISLQAKAPSSSGCSVGVEISTDGGLTFTSSGSKISLTSTNNSTKTIGDGVAPSTQWGRSFASTDFATGKLVVRLQDIRTGSCSASNTLSVNSLKVKVGWAAIGENSDSDNFFIATSPDQMQQIFNYVGDNVCPASRPVVDTTPTNASLIVITRLNNDNGTGTATSVGQFTNSVNSPTQASQVNPGVGAPGTTITIPPGQYNVTEAAMPGYTEILSDGCYADNTNLITAGETRVCIITNSDIPPPPALLIQTGTWQEVPSNI